MRKKTQHNTKQSDQTTGEERKKKGTERNYKTARKQSNKMDINI